MFYNIAVISTKFDRIAQCLKEEEFSEICCDPFDIPEKIDTPLNIFQLNNENIDTFLKNVEEKISDDKSYKILVMGSAELFLKKAGENTSVVDGIYYFNLTDAGLKYMEAVCYLDAPIKHSGKCNLF